MSASVRGDGGSGDEIAREQLREPDEDPEQAGDERASVPNLYRAWVSECEECECLNDSFSASYVVSYVRTFEVMSAAGRELVGLSSSS